MTAVGGITFRREQGRGRMRVREMLIRISEVLDLRASGLSAKQVVTELADLKLDDVSACLHHASAYASHATPTAS